MSEGDRGGGQHRAPYVVVVPDCSRCGATMWWRCCSGCDGHGVVLCRPGRPESTAACAACDGLGGDWDCAACDDEDRGREAALDRMTALADESGEDD